jgi:hypothetical protein
MSNYSTLITANSTFSWWAGYIGFLRGNMTQISMPKRFLANSKLDPAKHLVHRGITFMAN